MLAVMKCGFEEGPPRFCCSCEFRTALTCDRERDGAADLIKHRFAGVDVVCVVESERKQK
jgi:hypothetical protein